MQNPDRGNPTDADRARELAAACALACIEGLGNRTLIRLLDALGSARAILEAPAEMLGSIPGIRQAPVRELTRARHQHRPEAVLDALLRRDIWPVMAGMPAYPSGWARLADPPLVAFGRGCPRRGPATTVAIVGTRRATHHGRSRARQLARDLAELGISIVSGLAEGIDGMAHEGALDVGGHTVAVLGTPIDAPWPPSNRHLARRVLEARGIWLSERAPGRGMAQGGFLARNRLVAAMADVVVVVEAPARSGALHTLGLAAELGVPAFVLEGPADFPSFAGSRKAAEDGAPVIGDARDLLRAMDWAAAAPSKTRDSATGPAPAGRPVDDRARLLSALGHDLLAPATLAARLGWPERRLTGALGALILEGTVAWRGRCVFVGTASARR
ncbi:MAG: DNA-processing protein DprA [Candidatus Sericytochromatia bacterium]|nr:DNA-processing protein DprA [Candidatus Sericytochromatia bacterium]